MAMINLIVYYLEHKLSLYTIIFPKKDKNINWNNIFFLNVYTKIISQGITIQNSDRQNLKNKITSFCSFSW